MCERRGARLDRLHLRGRCEVRSSCLGNSTGADVMPRRLGGRRSKYQRQRCVQGVALGREE